MDPSWVAALGISTVVVIATTRQAKTSPELMAFAERSYAVLWVVEIVLGAGAVVLVWTAGAHLVAGVLLILAAAPAALVNAVYRARRGL